MDKKLLRGIGLAESEISVYSALLEMGSSKAGDLVNELSLHRSRIYDALNMLLEKGLVSYVIRNNVKYFEASDPEKLLTRVEEQKKMLDERKKEINKRGRNDLVTGIGRQGGFPKIRKLLGENLKRNPNGYYDNIGNVLRECREFMEEHGFDELPSSNKIAKQGRGDLVKGIERKGGFRKIRDLLSRKKQLSEKETLEFMLEAYVEA